MLSTGLLLRQVLTSDLTESPYFEENLQANKNKYERNIRSSRHSFIDSDRIKLFSRSMNNNNSQRVGYLIGLKAISCKILK